MIRAFRRRGRTVLLTTHYMDEAERLCDRVAIVDQGRVIALGTPRELIARLGGDHVIEFAVSDGQADPDGLRNLPGVRSARSEDGSILLQVAEPHVVLPAPELPHRSMTHIVLSGAVVTLAVEPHLRPAGRVPKSVPG